MSGKNYLLIAEDLEQYEGFVHRCASHLSSSGDQNQSNGVTVLVAPSPQGIWQPERLDRVQLVCGRTNNRQQLAQLLSSGEGVQAVFYFPRESFTSNSPAETGTVLPMEKLAGGNCTEVLHLLETLRSMDNPPMLVPVYINNNDNKNEGNGEKNQRELARKAHFDAAFAFYHAFVVSYRLKIQIARIDNPSKSEAFEGAFNFLAELSATNCKGTTEKVPISHYTIPITTVADQQGKETQQKSQAGFHRIRALVFGDPLQAGDDGIRGKKTQMFLDQLSRTECVTVLEAKTRPGVDVDAEIARELIEMGPTHVVYSPPKDRTVLAQFEEGGPTNLLSNVRQQLFTPWLLAKYCAEYGLNFVNLGEEAETNNKNGTNPLLENGHKQKGEINGQTEFTMSRCEVVRKFASEMVDLVEEGRK